MMWAASEVSDTARDAIKPE